MTRYMSGASVLIGDDNQRLEEEAIDSDSEEEHKELVEQPTESIKASSISVIRATKTSKR